MDPRLDQAIDLFNRREYFSSQERFEQVWRDTAQADRQLVASLVRLSVALHLHLNRGGGRGRNSLLQQCLVEMEDYRPAHLGIDVQALYDDVRAYLDGLTAHNVRRPRLFEGWRVPTIKKSG